MARLTHQALHVPNLDACIDFYRRYAGMQVIHRRGGSVGHPQRIVWMSEPGREADFVFVIMSGGQALVLPERDYRHLGFAVASNAEVDDIALRAQLEGCLLWPPRQEPFPVGYYCGLQDPGGNQVEFSYGQPLGPGAEAMAVFLDPGDLTQIP